MSLIFRPKTGKDQKMKNKMKKSLPDNYCFFFEQMKLESRQNEKTRSSPQIGGVMALHHNKVSSGAGPPTLATSLAL